MAKFLLLIAVFIIVYLVIRSARGGAQSGRAQAPPAGQPEDMVRCKVCGVHLPRSEGILSRGEFYCSQEHLRLASKGPSSR
ncbi:MAG TPA: PP0621 family protein [Burkholderiales bacterium]|nr:PP0621 family protein [Burkholderiales bacterium]